MTDLATPEPVALPAERSRRPKGVRLATDAAERIGLPVLLILLIVVFSLLRPHTFATTENFQTIASSQSVLAVTAMALIFPLIAGRFDISAGAIVGLTSVAVAGAMGNDHLGLLLAVLVALAIGALIGVANGVLVAYLGVNSIIGTIGTSTVIGGLIFAYTNGIPISSGISPGLTNLESQTIAGVPMLFVIMLAFGVLVWLVLSRTSYGRYLDAVGSNETAAALNGLPVRRIVMTTFICSGLLSACAGIMEVAVQGSANAQVGGIDFMLPALAAVFLGATTIFPGRYNVPGTITALYFVAVAISGLTLLGVQPWITDVFDGTAVIVALALAAVFRRRRTGLHALGA